jgi:hypothetical protein
MKMKLFISSSGLSVNPKIDLKKTKTIFETIGKLVGISIIEDMYLGLDIPLGFYKIILNEPITFEDMQYVDKDLYVSLNRPFEKLQGHVQYFTVYDPRVGKDVGLDDSPTSRGEDSSNRRVTRDNYPEYQRLMSKWKILNSQYVALMWMKDGFEQVVSLGGNLNGPLGNAIYVQKLVNGESRGVDLQKLIHFQNEPKSKQADWFMTYIGKMNSEKKGRFLQFVTGSKNAGDCTQILVSIGGVGRPSSRASRSGSQSEDEYFPVAHTCSFHVRIPKYKSYEQLEAKFNAALSETNFGLA